MDPDRDVVMYVTGWCGACRFALRFLDEHEISYRKVDIDKEPDAAALVMSLNNGNRSVPTILIDGEHALTEPSRRQLQETFGV